MEPMNERKTPRPPRVTSPRPGSLRGDTRPREAHLMLQRWRMLALMAVVALASAATVASADPGHGKSGAHAKVPAERLFTLEPDPAGNPEGVAFDKESKAFFVSITADGAI